MYCRVNNLVYCRLHQGVKRSDGHLGMDFLFNPGTTAPRYFFYPDANAFRAEILCEYVDATGKEVQTTHVLPLRAHAYLNGAYYFETLAPGYVPPKDSSTLSAISGEAEISSSIYVSQANNPFFFAPTDICTVGNSRILALSAAVTAMSQGQFGQYPLYAFSSDGIYALQPNDRGTYSTVSPVSRDVCSNPQGITQTDTEVLYPSARGLMVLSGSVSKCVSDAIDNKSPFNIPLNSLSGLDKLCAALSLSDNDCITIIPFRDFLSSARMVYDHAHQRIFVANADKNYAYVFSLSDSRWGMAESILDYAVLSYPYSLAVSRSFGLDDSTRCAVLDYSLYDNADSEARCMFVSRPLKLDAPDVLKSVSEAIIRGHFNKNHIAVALYGSRDLIVWQLIWSSANNRLRGFSGTPYKYFRLAASAFLYADESISGVSLNFSARYNNRLR